MIVLSAFTNVGTGLPDGPVLSTSLRGPQGRGNPVVYLECFRSARRGDLCGRPPGGTAAGNLAPPQGELSAKLTEGVSHRQKHTPPVAFGDSPLSEGAKAESQGGASQTRRLVFRTSMDRKTSNISICSTELSFGGRRLEGKPPYRRLFNDTVFDRFSRRPNEI